MFNIKKTIKYHFPLATKKAKIAEYVCKMLLYKLTGNLIRYNRALANKSMHSNDVVCESYPVALMLDIGNVCNQFCRYCSQVLLKQKKSVLSPDDFNNFTWLKFLSTIIFEGSHGDVFGNKQFPDIFRKIKEFAPYASYRVYTNGLGLCGENLDIVMDNFDAIHISLNAITESTYNKVIVGNYTQLMNNIDEIRKKKSKKQKFSVSYVLTAETVQDVNLIIDFAQRNNIDEVILYKGYTSPFLARSEKSLPTSSFLEDYSQFFDIEKLKKEAHIHGIDFRYRTNEEAYHNDKLCSDPWKSIRLDVVDGMYGMYICCITRPIISTSTFSNFADIKKYWNHERMQDIRKEVNTPSKTEHMCVFCRREGGEAVLTEEKIAENLKKYNIANFDTEYRFYKQLIID